MDPIGAALVSCPYCGEANTLVLDHSAGEQSYIEDCRVCCRPIEVSVRAAGGHMKVEVRRDDE